VGDFPGNSNKSKEKEKIEPVELSGNITLKKKSGFEKFTDAFISKDTGSIKHYIFTDVLIPAIKKATWDVFTSALDMLLYGGSAPSMRNASKGTTYINYASTINKPKERPSYISGSSVYDFDANFEFDSEIDAVKFLDRMKEIVYRYGIITVSDMYDLAGKVTDNYQATKYGWVDLNSAYPERVPYGRWRLRLPKPYPID